MNDVHVQRYLEDIETLLCQWDDIMVDTEGALVRDEQQHSLRHIHVLNILRNTPPSICGRLRTDLGRMIDAHDEMIFFSCIDHQSISSARSEYEEAVVTIHAELTRLRTHYAV